MGIFYIIIILNICSVLKFAGLMMKGTGMTKELGMYLLNI